MSQAVKIVVAGLGRAGRARVRDITGNILGENVAVLKGVISRHKPDNIDVPFLSWEEALSSKDVDAVIICTENCEHEEYARKSLQAGKHVLVEYPLTTNFSATKHLVELAEENNDAVLQEEDIGLLTDYFNELLGVLKTKPRVVKASINFIMPLMPSSWICDPKRGGFPSYSGVNRLHVIYELFGEMTVQEATMTVDDNKSEMSAKLLANGVPIVWSETRATDSSRSMTFHFEFQDGTTMDYSRRMGPPPRTTPGQSPPPKGLFAQDLDLFLKKIRGEVAEEEIKREKKRTLHCAEIAAKIEEIAIQKMSRN